MTWLPDSNINYLQFNDPLRATLVGNKIVDLPDDCSCGGGPDTTTPVTTTEEPPTTTTPGK